jgi:hypothetical protein
VDGILTSKALGCQKMNGMPTSKELFVRLGYKHNRRYNPWAEQTTTSQWNKDSSSKTHHMDNVYRHI